MKKAFPKQGFVFYLIVFISLISTSLFAQDKVGINTSNANLTHKLTISDTSASLLRLIGPGVTGEQFYGQGAKIEFGDLADRVYISEDSDDKLTLYGLSRLAMLSNGNIGIGTKNPLTKIHLEGTTLIRRQFGDALLIIEADSANNNESANPMIEFRQDGATTKAWVGFDEAKLGSNNFGISTLTRDGVLKIDTDGNIGINAPIASNATLGLRPVPGDIRILNIQEANGTNIFSVDVGGTVGVNQVFSDISLNVRGKVDDPIIFNAEDEAGANKFEVQRDGEVYIQNELGIGIGAPTEEIHVKTVDPTILLQSNSTSEPSGRVSLRQSNSTGFDIFYDGGPDKLVFEGFSGTTTQGQHMTIDFNTGNVGIGTTADANSNNASGYRLSVDGKIAATEVRVQPTAAWPDYVFEKEYTLLSIEDVKKSIELNNRLPGIPSAKEIEQNGVELGEMQRKMMEKIEELTLYIIQLKEEVDTLRQAHNDNK